MDVCGVTDKGLRRTVNQDSLYISADERLLVVADGNNRGVQDAVTGESELAAKTLESLWLSKQPDLTDDQAMTDWLQQSIGQANEAVLKLTSSSPAAKYGYTTVVAAVQADQGKVHIAHVGDSRAFVMKSGILQALTEDHTMLNHLKRTAPDVYERTISGKISACYMPDLMRFLGAEESIKVDQVTIDLTDVEWLLLCSDGLNDWVSDETISDVLRSSNTAANACEKLLAEVMQSGALDNVSIIAVHY